MIGHAQELAEINLFSRIPDDTWNLVVFTSILSEPLHNYIRLLGSVEKLHEITRFLFRTRPPRPSSSQVSVCFRESRGEGIHNLCNLYFHDFSCIFPYLLDPAVVTDDKTEKLELP